MHLFLVCVVILHIFNEIHYYRNQDKAYTNYVRFSLKHLPQYLICGLIAPKVWYIDIKIVYLKNIRNGTSVHPLYLLKDRYLMAKA